MPSDFIEYGNFGEIGRVFGAYNNRRKYQAHRVVLSVQRCSKREHLPDMMPNEQLLVIEQIIVPESEVRRRIENILIDRGYRTPEEIQQELHKANEAYQQNLRTWEAQQHSRAPGARTIRQPALLNIPVYSNLRDYSQFEVVVLRIMEGESIRTCDVSIQGDVAWIISPLNQLMVNQICRLILLYIYGKLLILNRRQLQINMGMDRHST